MTLNIHRLIAAIEPDLYCAPEARRAVKEFLRRSHDGNEMEVLRSAAELAHPQTPNVEDLQLLSDLDPFQLRHFECPLVKHALVHDALGDSVERIYFRLLDLLRQNGWEIAKLVDTVYASAASGLAPHLAEQAIRRQDHTRRLLRDVQQSVDRICQLQEEIQGYRHALPAPASRGPSPTLIGEGEPSALVSTSQSRDGIAAASEAGPNDGHNSAHARAAEHADPSDRFTRLQADLHREEAKLRIYARWIAPLLPPPIAPSPDETMSPDSVAGFDTALLNVVLLAAGATAVEEQFDSGHIPASLRRHSPQAALPFVVAEFSARTVPDQHASRGFTHRGRVEITLTGYALTPQQISRLQRFFDHDALASLLHALLPTEPDLVLRIISDLDSNPDRCGVPITHSAPPNPDPNPLAVLLTALRDLLVGLRQLVVGSTRTRAGEQALQRHAALLASLRCQHLYEALAQWVAAP